ncbi:hypothetical protein HPP92_015278 [Vanilla planifolia]|uniref:Calmodulin-binding domain-containing protein n=1 Tax=Vanilla planifolia TaxID=51239 RepID=A0A835QVL4_VANPL|nr:hypothetical protein HPP92_015800 [Vanilla planifolia]KAG0475592.1 hypothetical protein HPP92_015278 [Vanilla planifolia]
MAATKPTTLQRERRLSPSTSLLHSMEPRPDRSNQHGPFSGGTSLSSPALVTKVMPSCHKPKVASPSEPYSRTSASTVNTNNSSSRSSSTRKPVDKPPSYLGQTQRSPPSTTTTQRSLKPISPTPRLTSSSKSYEVRGTSRITRGARTTPVMKSKNSSSSPIKKKESAARTEGTSHLGEHPLDHRVAMDEVVADALADLNNFVEGSEVKSHRGEHDDNHTEEIIGELWSEGLELQVVNGDTKQHVMIDEAPKPTRVMMATAMLEKSDDTRVEPSKVMTVGRHVVPEATNSRLGNEIAHMVVTRHVKKDVPRCNDVIEETKSKLMGVKKNRVLALVGAFETVISLQDPEAQQRQKTLQVYHDKQIQNAQSFEHIIDTKQSRKDQHDYEFQNDQWDHEIHKRQSLGGDEARQNEQREEDK